MKRKYIILLAINKDNAALEKLCHAHCKQTMDSGAYPHWMDAKGAGMCVFTDWPALAIRQSLVELLKQRAELSFLEHLAVLELGQDHAAKEDSRLLGWLHGHA